MTTVAIMQPYLFPYIGYYQLVALTDVLVFLDDVNYIKRGFINRNTVIEPGGRPVRFTLPVHNTSQNRPINEHRYAHPGEKPVRTVSYCYDGARGFEVYYPLFEEIVHGCEGKRVSEVNAASITRVADMLRINTRFLTASEIDSRRKDGGQGRILRLCRELGAERYLNLPGGRSLYDPRAFDASGIALEFIEPSAVGSCEGGDVARPPSFLHELMTRGGEEAAELLRTGTAS